MRVTWWFVALVWMFHGPRAMWCKIFGHKMPGFYFTESPDGYTMRYRNCQRCDKEEVGVLLDCEWVTVEKFLECLEWRRSQR